jgi:glycosyltransferase involved in cell wall biosynthesis
VYDSLLNQTFKDFIWIIVDDASQDTTKEVVNGWIKEGLINIQYIPLDENHGKPNAVNHGLDFCETRYTIIADSDDTFVSNTLEDLLSLWKVVHLTSEKICAIWSLVRDEEGNIKGDYFPKDLWQVNFEDRILNVDKKLQGDKWHCWKTEILKAQKLYSNPNCHIQESLTWNDINKTYDYLCVNTTFLTAFYTEGSLITAKKSRKELAHTYYYGSYYGLINVATGTILSNKYYRYLAFEYIKSKLYFSDKNLKLSTSKWLVCILIFVAQIPKRIFKQI